MDMEIAKESYINGQNIFSKGSYN